jgi:hypothetical protein
MLDIEIENAIVEAMNQAEGLLMNSQSKKTFVILTIKQKFPDVAEKDIEDSIEILVHVSKISVRLLINLVKKNKCCLIA